MSQVGVRYIGFLACLIFVFSGFVACGAQFYQVSLSEDTSIDYEVSKEATDPNSPRYGLHAPNGWRTLPIRFRTGYTLTSEQRTALNAAMAAWEMAVGRNLFVYEGVHEGVTGDTFPDLYGSLRDGINGHYLDENWDKTGKPTVVLATTIWDNDPKDVKRILTADIRFNSHHYLLGDSFKLKADHREVVDMQTLAMHELGHLLGLAHVSPSIDPQSIMLPSIFVGEGLANRRLSRGDIERAQKIYGCGADACDLDTTQERIVEMDLKQRRAKSETTR